MESLYYIYPQSKAQELYEIYDKPNFRKSSFGITIFPVQSMDHPSWAIKEPLYAIKFPGNFETEVPGYLYTISGTGGVYNIGTNNQVSYNTHPKLLPRANIFLSGFSYAFIDGISLENAILFIYSKNLFSDNGKRPLYQGFKWCEGRDFSTNIKQFLKETQNVII